MARTVEVVTPCRVEFQEHDSSVKVDARLHFTEQLPYDIRLSLEAGGKEMGIVWTLSREMMDRAAHHPRSKEGEGDLVIETFGSHFSMLLRPPQSEPARLILNRIPIKQFMDTVNQVMPFDAAVRAVLHQLDEHPDWLNDGD